SFLPNGIGAITSSEHIRPDGNGITVYVHVDDLETALMKVTEGGGQVIVPKSPLGEDGFFAVVFDSEGNRVGFHSQS
ncbi:MAG: VOC family protein, partial [Chloroflexota bacterium]